MLDLAFDSPRTGLAITGRDVEVGGEPALYGTQDGARAWSRIRLPTNEPLADIAVGGGSAYALTSDCTLRSNSCHHATLWSIDPSGNTAPTTFDTLPKATSLGSITLAAYGSHVWVLLLDGGGGGAAFETSDRGRSWHKFDAGSCVWETLVATSPKVLWEACGTGMEMHFTRQATNASPTPAFTQSLSPTTSAALLPLTDTTAFAVTPNDRGMELQTTDDGGHTHETLAELPHNLVRKTFQTIFVSKHLGYLVTLNGGQLFRTTDQGQTWTPVSDPS
jgi:photosystem II stability/assembly factor-like uncharacterized protein